MRWTFELDSDSLYVSLSEETPTRQVELPSGVVVDVDNAGRAVGVEILRASSGWSAQEIQDHFNLDSSDLDSLRWLSKMQLQVAVNRAHGLAPQASGEPGTDQTIRESDLLNA